MNLYKLIKTIIVMMIGLSIILSASATKYAPNETVTVNVQNTLWRQKLDRYLSRRKQYSMELG